MWLKEGLTPFLATVVSTYGSSPRPQGSMMAWCPEKGLAGSLSGGCIEEALLEQLRAQSPTTPCLITYGKTSEEQARLKLPCGGHLEVLLEQFDQGRKVHIEHLLDSLNRSQKVSREVNLKTGSVSVTASVKTELQDNYWNHNLSPEYQLLLIGAGEVSRCVAELGKSLGYKVSLCDYRETFLQGWQVSEVDIYKTMPDDLIKERFSHSHCAILCLAHDPRLDDMALMQALTTEAFYIGAMGSKPTTIKRKERLMQLGLEPKEINRLQAPIGINIPSKTPYEIAISIMAGLIQAKGK